MYQIVGVGHSCIDKICTVENYPKEDSSTHITSVSVQGGGAVATAMVTVSKLGMKTCLIGNIGFDRASDEIVAEFEKDGVSTDYLARRDDCFGLESFVMVNPKNGSRTKFPFKDKNPEIVWDEKLIDVIKKADVVHLDGTHYQNAMNAARICKEYNVLISLDGCSMQNDNDKNLALAKMADILIMNSKYPLLITGKESYEEALLEISAWGVGIVGCTLGDKGSLFVVDGKVIAFKAFNVDKVVDTTGCGDVFHGAFLFSYIRDKDLEKAIGFASLTAALKCSEPGGRAGIPEKDTVLKILGEQLYNV